MTSLAKGTQYPYLPPDYPGREAVQLLLEGCSFTEVHENWCYRMREHGWVYGGYDLRGKTHPNLVRYCKLDGKTRQAMELIFDDQIRTGRKPRPSGRGGCQ